MLASTLGSALLFVTTLSGEMAAPMAHAPQSEPAAAWWTGVTHVEPILCPVVDRRYNVRALCGAALYVDVDNAGELRDLRAEVAADVASGSLGPGAPVVQSAEVIAVDDGRAAVVARVKGRDRAAALLRWAKGLVSGVGAPVASVRNSR